jgi:AAA domain
MSAQPSPDLSFNFCTIAGRFDTKPSQHTSTFAGLADYLGTHVRMVALTREQYLKLSKPEQAEVKDGPAIILAAFKRDGVRTDDAVDHTTGIGLDVDEAHVELDELRALLDGHAAIIYESANSMPNARRWRVLLPYAGPCTPELHERAFEHWRERIPGVGQQSRNPSRLWYTITQFAKSPKRIFEVIEGEAFDPASLGTLKRSSRDAFLAKIQPPADAPAAEGARNAQLSRYAATVVKDCETEEQFAEALLDMSATYHPPLPDKEVRQMARAKWKVRAKFGWVPFEQTMGSPDEPAEDDTPPGFDIGDLIDYEAGDVPWIVQDVLTYGAHLLVGRPKGGKSWITLDMAYACINGGTFLGKQARKTGVLWISAEDTKASLSRRLKVRSERAEGAIVMTCESLKAERAKWEDCSFAGWLRAFLEAHPGIGLVIMDTHATVEALWAHEAIDEKRNASIVAQAYQMSRIYEDIGQESETCIVLVHHAAKRKGKDVTDYHELINLPATVVAGSTASLVLADPPDRDIHDEDDHRRVFAVRGRHIIGEAPLLIELKDARANLLGVFHEIRQTEAQAEVLEAIEALLEEQDSTTIAEVAAALGKHKNTVQGALRRAAKAGGGTIKWKGRVLEVKQAKGIRWKS